MLLRKDTLEGIAAGRVTLQFRWWKRPTVKAGGTLRSRVGVLAIQSVDVIDEAELTDEEARRAGYRDRADAVAQLEHQREPARRLYRIAFTRAGEDPRIALRNDDRLDDATRTAIDHRLERLDSHSKRGPWTLRTLELIRDNPGTRAVDLAHDEGLEKLPFKLDVRKLKELGLTESLVAGYRLSPRGQAYLAAVSRSAPRAPQR